MVLQRQADQCRTEITDWGRFALQLHRRPGNRNMLIHGDNLLALKALENKFSGSIKTIYIRTVKKHCSKVQIIQQKAAQKVQVIWNLVSDCAANGSYLCNSLFDLRVLEDAWIFMRRIKIRWFWMLFDPFRGVNLVLIYSKTGEITRSFSQL